MYPQLPTVAIGNPLHGSSDILKLTLQTCGFKQRKPPKGFFVAYLSLREAEQCLGSGAFAPKAPDPPALRGRRVVPPGPLPRFRAGAPG